MLALILDELGSIPMLLWQYAAVLGFLAVILVLTRPMHITPRQAGWVYSIALGLAGYAISALLHIDLPPPSSAPIRYDLLFLAGMLGGWRGGVLGYVLIFGARLQWAGTMQWAYTGIDMAIVTLGGVWSHRWYRDLDLADLTTGRVLWMWALRSLTLIASGVVLVGLHKLPKELVFFDLLPYRHSMGSLVRTTLMAGPALLFFASVFAMFRLDAQDRRRQKFEWLNNRRDALTQLPNRRALGEYLDQRSHAADGRRMALISIGAGNHTQMLLSRGHAWRELFLRQLADATQEEPVKAMLAPFKVQAFQFTDFCLVLVLNDTSVSELEDAGLANRVHQGLSMRMHGLARADAVPVLTMTVTHCGTQHQADVANTLRDLSLYLQTQVGEARNVQFLHTSFTEAARRDAHLLTQLGEWINSGNPPLSYMPQCDLATRKVTGAEALLRHQDEHGALVPPAHVLGLAARHKLLGALEWCTIERVCRDARRWAQNGEGRSLSVNISSASMVTVQFAQRLCRLLDDNGLARGAIVLELTEYDEVPDIDSVRENARLLHESGIRLSLDDFGSGYSALTVLARFQFAELKIDHSMVAMIDDPRMRSAIQLALESAQRYGANFVAEGVETESHRHRLLELGIHQGQGYLFSRAVSLDKLMAFAATAKTTHKTPATPLPRGGLLMQATTL